MHKETRDGLNEHLKLEYAAWHEYAAMSAWFDLEDLPGFAAFFRAQSDEELTHAQRIVAHLMERDQAPVLPAIPKPPESFSSPGEVLRHFLAGEQKVSASIRELYSVAEKHGDQPARIMLEWFITEQVEEEALARGLIGRLKHAGETGPGLLMIDQELSRAAPAPEAAAE